MFDFVPKGLDKKRITSIISQQLRTRQPFTLSFTYYFFHSFQAKKAYDSSWSQRSFETRVESIKFLSSIWKGLFRCRVYSYELDESASCDRECDSEDYRELPTCTRIIRYIYTQCTHEYTVDTLINDLALTSYTWKREGKEERVTGPSIRHEIT